MTIETILTGDQIDEILMSHGATYTDVNVGICRSVEQSVLESPEVQALRKDALFGRVAMRFVDRAGDYCKEDPAEKICDEFNAAIHAAMEQQK